MRPRAGQGMAGSGSNWLSGVNVVLVMAYGSLVSRAGAGRPGGTGLMCPWGPGARGTGPGVSVGLPWGRGSCEADPGVSVRPL